MTGKTKKSKFCCSSESYQFIGLRQHKIKFCIGEKFIIKAKAQFLIACILVTSLVLYGIHDNRNNYR